MKMIPSVLLSGCQLLGNRQGTRAVAVFIRGPRLTRAFGELMSIVQREGWLAESKQGELYFYISLFLEGK